MFGQFTPLMSLTFMFLNSTGVVNVSDNDISYPVYVFTGTIFYRCFVTVSIIQ